MVTNLRDHAIHTAAIHILERAAIHLAERDLTAGRKFGQPEIEAVCILILEAKGRVDMALFDSIV